MKLLKYIYWHLYGRRKFFNVQFKNVKTGEGVILKSSIPVGEYTFIGEGTILGPNCRSIGRYCSIARNVIIGPNNHPLDKLSTSSCFYTSNWTDSKRNIITKNYNQFTVIIENDVWIGINAVIIGDVTIGTGAVIGANTVVTRDVPPYAIVVGTPGKIIKYRFNEIIRSKLLDSKWWELPLDKATECYTEFNGW